jgi:DNA-binding transcriptional MerR regulator
MTLRLYKVAEVCEIAQLQPYVLKSWEKEFPGIGLLKADDSGRLYRQSDLDQVLRIKQLVFGEGLTLAGARRRMEEAVPSRPADDVAEALEVLGADVRKRIGHVRDGLRSLLDLLATNGNHHEVVSPLPPVPTKLIVPGPTKAKTSARRAKTTPSKKAVPKRGKSATTRKTSSPRKRVRV